MSESTSGEVDQLRHEMEALQRQLTSERARRHARRRSVLTGVLTVLAVLATTAALLAVWTFRTLTDTELFVDRVGPVIEEPEVSAAVGVAAAAEVIDALQVEQRLRDALPEDVAVAAGPISTAAQNLLAEGATRLVGTEQFEAAWDAALAGGHRLSIGVLSGRDTTAIENTDGVVVLDLTPVINLLLAEGSGFLSDLTGREISAPAVTADAVDEAITALEERLGVDLPADFGQVTLFSSDDLAVAQAAYQAIRVMVWLAPIVALVLIGLAVAVSTRRVRTTMSVVVGTGLLLLLAAVALQPLQSSIVAAVEDQGLAGAVEAGFGTVFSSLRAVIVVGLVLAVIAAGVLFLSGESAAAASGRRLVGHAPGLAATYRGWFLGAGAAVALLVLAVIPGRTWGQLLFVLLLYAAFALAVLLAPRRVEAAP
jgi:hypothetical protein